MIRKTESRQRECLGAYRAPRHLAEPLRDIGEPGEVTVGTRPISPNEQGSDIATSCASDRFRVHAPIDQASTGPVSTGVEAMAAARDERGAHELARRAPFVLERGRNIGTPP